mmetsp:Transcript_66193/g.215404  ORF Transcript_66193/g.215404 Transcript_66193/m.215404 type:complete len:101 (+) Transcript_66193:29-331(+)
MHVLRRIMPSPFWLKAENLDIVHTSIFRTVVVDCLCPLRGSRVTATAPLSIAVEENLVRQTVESSVTNSECRVCRSCGSGWCRVGELQFVSWQRSVVPPL